LRSTADIEVFLGTVRDEVQAEVKHLLPLFDVFAEEARFARGWLEPRLAVLPAGAQLLEVGAGLMLLSAQLAREGFRVTALEPVGTGFSVFNELQAFVRRHAERHGIAFTTLRLSVEELRGQAIYDFAFSVNVMEHVGDVEAAIANVTRALKQGASYAFFCPNYRFPYEPHFGIPIVGSKRLTARLFDRVIRSNPRVPDPEGVWQSLNWISVGMIDRICRRLEGLEWHYDRSVFTRALERITHDPRFASRRAPWMRGLSRFLVASRLHRLASFVPASLQPAIDCTIVQKCG
jgi:SAM-dependent methyltransferase